MGMWGGGNEQKITPLKEHPAPIKIRSIFREKRLYRLFHAKHPPCRFWESLIRGGGCLARGEKKCDFFSDLCFFRENTNFWS